MRPLAAIVAILLVAGAVAACGDDDDNNASTGTTTSTSQTPSNGTTGPDTSGSEGENGKAGEQAGGKTGDGPATATTPAARRRLIKRADRRCRGGRDAQLRLERRLAQMLTRLSPEQSAQTARLAGQELELLRTEQTQVEALPVAAKDEAKLKRLLQAYTQRIAQLSSLRRALLRRDLGGALTLNSRSTALKALQRSAARDFGFEVCGVARIGPPTP